MISAGAHPFPAVDTSAVRTTERLAAFQTEWMAKKPVDQYFARFRTLDWLNANCKQSVDGGAQLGGHIGHGESPNSRWASDYDEYTTSGSDSVDVVVYRFVNIYDASTISYSEMRELEGKDHALFNRVGEKRDLVINTTLKRLNSGLYAAAQDAEKITCLPIAIDSTGAVGGLSAATVTEWAAQEVDAVNLAGMYEKMKTLRDQLWNIKASPQAIFTTFAIRRYIEGLFDPDVRYMSSGELARGVGNDPNALIFSGLPIMADADAPAGYQFWIDPSLIALKVDSVCDMKFGEPEKAPKQWAYTTPFIHKTQLVVKGRREQGKLINCA